MQCEKCGSQLEPEMELCPQCGTKADQNEAEIVSLGKQIKILLIVKMIVSALLVLTLLCAMVMVIFKDELIPGHWFSSLPGSIPKDGNSDNITCEGTYTSSRFAIKGKSDAVVAQIGDEVLTNAQLQVFYVIVRNNFFQTYTNLSAINLDQTLPMDRQTCGLDESLSWQQYFLQEALDQWRLYVLLCRKADVAGCELTEAEQQTLNERTAYYNKMYVESGEYASLDAWAADVYGPGCIYADYQHYATMAALASKYYNQMIKEQETLVTEEDIEGFYEEQKELFEIYNIQKGDGNITVDVRHILITVKAATGKEEHIEETDWEKTKEKAQEVLDQWLAGEATEESFAALAEENSADPGSNLNGGLYAGVQKGDMVAEFEAWCFDASREPGDYGLVRTDHGYHIMYFVGSEELWHNVSKQNAPTWRTNKLLEQERDALSVQIRYNKICTWEEAYYAE